jgi:phosphoketolase
MAVLLIVLTEAQRQVDFPCSQGTITTPFDMTVVNDMDRFHLVGDAIDRLPHLGSRAAYVKQAMRDKLIAHRHYITRHGEDMPEIRHWQWGQYTTAATHAC